MIAAVDTGPLADVVTPPAIVAPAPAGATPDYNAIAGITAEAQTSGYFVPGFSTDANGNVSTLDGSQGVNPTSSLVGATIGNEGNLDPTNPAPESVPRVLPGGTTTGPDGLEVPIPSASPQGIGGGASLPSAPDDGRSVFGTGFGLPAGAGGGSPFAPAGWSVSIGAPGSRGGYGRGYATAPAHLAFGGQLVRASASRAPASFGSRLAGALHAIGTGGRKRTTRSSRTPLTP